MKGERKKKILSLILSVLFLVNGVYTGSVAHAEGETQAENAVYVDGINGSDENDGLTDATPLKTMSAAYARIPAENERFTIVVCGEVRLSDTGFATGTKAGRYLFPYHGGEVVITSKIGEADYTAAGVLNFDGKIYGLQGNTTFEHIRIASPATQLCAYYYPLKLGEGIVAADGISYAPAKAIYLGRMNAGTTEKFTVRNAEFTMKSGNIDTLFGGSFWYNVPAEADYGVSMTIQGGKIHELSGTTASKYGFGKYTGIAIEVGGGVVDKLYGADSNGEIGADGIRITLKKDAAVYEICAAVEGASVSGEKILNLEGFDSGTFPEDTAISGFHALGLTGSTLTLPEAKRSFWEGMQSLRMTDNSLLHCEAAPADTLEVTVAKSGESWNTAVPLIIAPAGTGEDIFSLVSPVGYAFSYADDGTSSTWTLTGTADSGIGELTQEEGSVLDYDLKLPDNYTVLPEDASAYDTYLAKMQDLTNAGSGQEVPVIEPVAVKGEVAIYVDPVSGDDGKRGSKEEPLRTIKQALKKVEMLQSGERAWKGIVVYLREGTYFTDETIALGSVHSGKNGIPVMISAYEDEQVVITGGSSIPGSRFKKVNEVSADAYNKLPVSARDEVVAVRLEDLGISAENLAITKNGANYQVFVDGEELTLSRYPNTGKLALTGTVEHIGAITASYSDLGPAGTNADDPDIRFGMSDLRPTLWENDGNIWLNGSLYAEWEINNIRVKEANAVTGIMRLDGGTGLGAKSNPDNKYYYYNILEELDVPGEFYLDTDNGILYLYPISDMSTAVVVLSAMQKNLIELNRTEAVVLNGLTIENSAEYGIYMTECSRTLVQNCTLRNLGYGVKIQGRENGVIYSDIYQIANRPVVMGQEIDYDFCYEWEKNFLQNCYIHTTGTKNSKICNVYVAGTGNVVSHNLLQGMYGVGIYLQNSTECIVEYNEIVGAPTGIYDYAAIYHTYNTLSTGTHVRYNYIHDIGTFSEKQNPSAVYFDEGLRGNYAYGNIMVNVPCGFYTNSGSENVILHNIVMDGREESQYAIRAEDHFASHTIEQAWTRNSSLKKSYEVYLALPEAKKTEIKGRYPLLVKLYKAIEQAGGTGCTGLFASKDNYVHENLIYNHGTVNFTENNDVGNNTIVSAVPFRNVQEHDFSLTDSSIITWNDKLPSAERMGVLTTNRQTMRSFSMYAPSDGNRKVNPFRVLLKWSNAGGADDYTVKISGNADLSDAKSYKVTNRYCSFENDDYFTYDTEYYWTVTANTTAKSRSGSSCAANEGEIFNFRTLTREEFLEQNPLDTVGLEEKIAQAENFLAQIKDIREGGLYENGTCESLLQSISAAKEILNALDMQDQVSIHQATIALENAIRKAICSRVLRYVTLENMSADEWSDLSGKKVIISAAGEELQMKVPSSRSEAVYTKGVGVRDIFCFQYKLDTKTAWNGFAVAQTNTNSFITSGTDGYFICINPTQIELQKYQGGTKVVQIDYPIDDQIFDGGAFYSVEIGAINYADGSVGIHFKINNHLIFDPAVYLDTATDEKLPGDPIANATGFGIVVHSGNGVTYLRQADADYTALEEELEKEPANGEEIYTADSWSVYQQVIARAKALPRDLKMTEQETVEELVKALKAAREALVKKTEEGKIPIEPSAPAEESSSAEASAPAASSEAAGAEKPSGSPSPDKASKPVKKENAERTTAVENQDAAAKETEALKETEAQEEAETQEETKAQEETEAQEEPETQEEPDSTDEKPDRKESSTPGRGILLAVALLILAAAGTIYFYIKKKKDTE